MYFSNVFNDDEEYNIIECVNLDNNLLLYKQEIDENQHYMLKLKENQCAIIFKEGQLFDIAKEKGIYNIKIEQNPSFPKKLLTYKIKNNNDSLCIIFFNLNIIKNNKFYIKKKHKYDFFGEGEFDFKIENPLRLFSKVIEIRTYYSREELLEQIRERISKIVTSVIKKHEGEYSIEELINSSVNIFNEYGIKIVSSNIKNVQFKKK